MRHTEKRGFMNGLVAVAPAVICLCLGIMIGGGISKIENIPDAIVRTPAKADKHKIMMERKERKRISGNSEYSEELNKDSALNDDTEETMAAAEEFSGTVFPETSEVSAPYTEYSLAIQEFTNIVEEETDFKENQPLEDKPVIQENLEKYQIGSEDAFEDIERIGLEEMRLAVETQNTAVSEKREELLILLSDKLTAYQNDSQEFVDQTLQNVNKQIQTQVEAVLIGEETIAQQLVDEELVRIQEENKRVLNDVIEEINLQQEAYIKELEIYANQYMQDSLEELTMLHVDETSWQLQGIIGDFLLSYDDSDEDWDLASSSNADFEWGVYEIELSTPGNAMMDFDHPDAPKPDGQDMTFEMKQAIPAKAEHKNQETQIWIEIPKLEIVVPETELSIPKLGLEEAMANEILALYNLSEHEVEDAVVRYLTDPIRELLEEQAREIEQLRLQLNQSEMEQSETIEVQSQQALAAEPEQPVPNGAQTRSIEYVWNQVQTQASPYSTSISFNKNEELINEIPGEHVLIENGTGEAETKAEQYQMPIATDEEKRIGRENIRETKKNEKEDFPIMFPVLITMMGSAAIWTLSGIYHTQRSLKRSLWKQRYPSCDSHHIQ